MRALVALMLLVIPSSAYADGQVVKACLRAAAHFHVRDEVFPTTVQDFSHLAPPRAVIRYAPTDASEEPSRRVDCFFETAASPLVLTEFCMEGRCVKAGQGNATLENIQDLLRRDGF